MIKAIILGCVICVGAGGMAVWVKSTSGSAAANAKGTPPATASVISIPQMHSNVNMDGLPIQTFEPH